MNRINWLTRNAFTSGISAYQKYENFSIPFMEKGIDSWVIGITGVAAAGKSALIKQLIKDFRKKDLTVAALLIDPSSDDGSALLGDRNELRDRELDLDSGVIIRSLASRGEKSALTRALPKIISFARCYADKIDIVIVETAGAGQTDVEIEKHVDTLVQVLAPLGSALTLEKSGQNEKAHIFAVNDRKSFTEGTNFFAMAQIKLEERKDPDGWQKKVFLVNAKEKIGIAELVEGLYAHKKFLEQKKSRD